MDRKLQRHRADSLRQHGFLVTYSRLVRSRLLADRTDGCSYATVLRPSSVVRDVLCIVAKRCVIAQKLLLTAYRKSYIRNWLVGLPK